MLRIHLIVTAVVLLSWAGTADALCGAQDNLLSNHIVPDYDNCGFDSTIGDWTPVLNLGGDFGTPGHSPDGGFDGTGGLQVDAAVNIDPFGNYYAAGAEVCVPMAVTTGESYGFGLRVSVSETLGMFDSCTAVFIFDNLAGDCSSGSAGNQTNVPLMGITAGTFYDLAGTALLTATTDSQSILLRVTCNSYSDMFTGDPPIDFVMTVDDAYIGPRLYPAGEIFSDGFESGLIDAWIPSP